MCLFKASKLQCHVFCRCLKSDIVGKIRYTLFLYCSTIIARMCVVQAFPWLYPGTPQLSRGCVQPLHGKTLGHIFILLSMSVFFLEKFRYILLLDFFYSQLKLLTMLLFFLLCCYCLIIDFILGPLFFSLTGEFIASTPC